MSDHRETDDATKNNDGPAFDEPPGIELRAGDHNGHLNPEKEGFDRCYPVMVHCRSEAEAKRIARLIQGEYDAAGDDDIRPDGGTESGVTYRCSGCGAEIDGPPSEPPAFDSPIEAFDCAVCEFVHPRYQDRDCGTGLRADGGTTPEGLDPAQTQLLAGEFGPPPVSGEPPDGRVNTDTVRAVVGEIEAEAVEQASAGLVPPMFKAGALAACAGVRQQLRLDHDPDAQSGGRELVTDGGTRATDKVRIDREDVRLRVTDEGPLLEIGETEILLRTFLELGARGETWGDRRVELSAEIDCDGDNGCWFILTPDEPGELYPWIDIQPEVRHVDRAADRADDTPQTDGGPDPGGGEREIRTDGGVAVGPVSHDEYRFVVACKDCGVVDEVTLTHEEARTDTGPTPIEDDPARLHYERTGHTCARLNYTNAPPDVREMLDGGEPDDIDWKRVLEWLNDA